MYRLAAVRMRLVSVMRSIVGRKAAAGITLKAVRCCELDMSNASCYKPSRLGST